MSKIEDRRKCRWCGEPESGHFYRKRPGEARLCMQLIGVYDPVTPWWQRILTLVRRMR